MNKSLKIGIHHCFAGFIVCLVCAEDSNSGFIWVPPRILLCISSLLRGVSSKSYHVTMNDRKSGE